MQGANDNPPMWKIFIFIFRILLVSSGFMTVSLSVLSLVEVEHNRPLSQQEVPESWILWEIPGRCAAISGRSAVYASRAFPCSLDKKNSPLNS